MLLSIREVAEMLQATENQVYRWIERDALPVQKVYESQGVNATELLEWATVRQLPVSPVIFGHVNGDAARYGSFAEALARGGIAERVPGHDRRALIAAALQGVQWPTGFDVPGLLQLILARESEGATAVGKGVAIPHPRFPVVLPGCTSLVRLCYAENAVDFGAADRVPVKTLVLVVCPTVATHLRILAILSQLLRQPEFQQAVDRRLAGSEMLTLVRSLENSLLPAAGLHEAGVTA